MTVSAILDSLKKDGLTISIDGTNLRVNGPSEVIDRHRETIRSHKLAIIDHLSFDTRPEVTCGTCRHYIPNRLNPEHGLGRCRFREPSPLPWPNAPRRCWDFKTQN